MDGKRFSVARDYIEEAREHGKPDDEIRAALRRAGWEDDELAELFSAQVEPPQPAAAGKPGEADRPAQGPRSMRKITVAVAWVWLVLSGLGMLACVLLLVLVTLVGLSGGGGEHALIGLLLASALGVCAGPVLAGSLATLGRRAWGWWMLLVAMAIGCAACVIGISDVAFGHPVPLDFLLLMGPAAAVGTIVVLLRDHPRHWSAPPAGVRPGAGGRLAVRAPGPKSITRVAGWVWLGMPVVSVVWGLISRDLDIWSLGIAWTPLPLLGAIGLLYRKAWGWWLLAAMMTASCTLYGLLTATGLAFSQNPKMGLDTWLLIVAVAAAATLVILLRDSPRNWVERG